MPAHLGGLVGAAHPALDAHIGPAAGARARAAPRTGRRWRSAPADSRGLKRGDHHFAHFARRRPDRRCRAHDLDAACSSSRTMPSRRAGRLVGDRCRDPPCRSDCEAVDAALAAALRARGGRYSSPEPCAFFRRRHVHLQFVRLLDDHLAGTKACRCSRGPQVARSRAPAFRSGRCRRESPRSRRVRAGLHHRAGRREVIGKSVDAPGRRRGTRRQTARARCATSRRARPSGS